MYLCGQLFFKFINRHRDCVKPSEEVGDGFCSRAGGFTLVELALVVLIGGILLAALGSALAIYMEKTQLRTTNQRLAAISDALQQHLHLNGRLPCPASRVAVPDTAMFGREVNEDCTSGAHAGTDRATGTDGRMVRIGAVPVRSINLPDDYALDAWGNRFTFAITEILATAGMYDRTGGAISIVDSTNNSVVTPDGSAHYVIVSHGRDGAGAYTAAGTAGIPCSTGTLDAENCNGTATFRRTMLAARTEAAGHYDDLMHFRAVGTFGDAVPPGAVQAFNLSACPPGWVAFAAAQGRTVIGAGTLGSETYSAADTGGQVTHALTMAQLGQNTLTGAAPDPGTTDYAYFTGTAPAPLDVRQPYIALLYCEKT